MVSKKSPGGVMVDRKKGKRVSMRVVVTILGKVEKRTFRPRSILSSLSSMTAMITTASVRG